LYLLSFNPFLPIIVEHLIKLQQITGIWILGYRTVKKNLLIFPSPAGMSLAKLSLAGNNENLPGQGEFG
jgi:hypothetical protein